MGMLLTDSAAVEAIRTLGGDYARITNPAGTFPPVEIVPLGPRHRCLAGVPAAVLLDMDGTITQTEPLFLHGVAQVVRRVTGWSTVRDWPGLDPERDYPQIVGYSTLRNLEYLYGCCEHAIQPALFFRAALEGLVFLHAHDSPRETVRWLDGLTETYGLAAWRSYADDPARSAKDGLALAREASARFPRVTRELFAHIGLIIFHADYIEALEQVNRGHGEIVSRAVYGRADVPAIAPMPGITLLCALLRGWLPPESAAALAPAFSQASEPFCSARGSEDTLRLLAGTFRRGPVPVGLVTSSGTHEASMVLRAVFQAMVEEVRTWPLDRETIATAAEGLERFDRFFDVAITCDDVAGGRTKPFRDPYSLALAKLGLTGEDAGRVIGFEDTEAGIIAQRGAGIGVPCAVPIEHTMNHDFSAAAHILRGGVYEAIFAHRLFLPRES